MSTPAYRPDEVGELDDWLASQEGMRDVEDGMRIVRRVQRELEARNAPKSELVRAAALLPEATEALAEATEENARLRSLLQRMADRFDYGRNGKCGICGSGRPNGEWDMSDMPLVGIRPPPCSNEECFSHEVRETLSPSPKCKHCGKFASWDGEVCESCIAGRVLTGGGE